MNAQQVRVAQQEAARQVLVSHCVSWLLWRGTEHDEEARRHLRAAERMARGEAELDAALRRAGKLVAQL